MTELINYKPPTTIAEFIYDHKPGELFYDWIVGPVGSGKTTGIFMKLVHMASMQAPSPSDGVRRSRCVVVRNTMPQLRDTTIASWSYWFKDGIAGNWAKTAATFTLKFGDVECEVLFRPLDSAEDVQRVLSLEVTFAIIDEFVQIPRTIVDALSARLGRYPSKKDGGATNWGMWGASNTDTEDNWWFEYLNDASICQTIDVAMPRDLSAAQRDAHATNVKYFKQPSGFSPQAENIENLPGGRGYYESAKVGKSDAWVKQFIESEWGYSISGKPVVPAFKSDLHVARSRLKWNPLLPLVVGVDPGIGGTACVFGQEDLHGRLLVLAEIVAEGYGASRFIAQKFKPFVRNFFPNAQIVIAPDPASKIRGQRDEVPLIREWEKHYDVQVESNNRLPLRLDAIEHFATFLTDAGPALLIDPYTCPGLLRALKGGWRFEMNTRKEQLRSAEPEKNKHSHVGDGFGYLARYFHRQGQRAARYGAAGRKPFVPPRNFGGGYHAR